MKTWLESWWESLRANFWFVPTVMSIGAVVLSLTMINVDKRGIVGERIARLGFTFARGPEGSRALLSTAAGSMMTITSVTFSITIVALQLASSQFGPRLLGNFMRDRGNQISLGTFIATFTYCLLVLRTVNGTEAHQFVPHLSVTIGLLMTLASVGVLIYFIHHAAASIQAENVIESVGRDLDHAVARLFPTGLGRDRPEGRSGRLPETFDDEAKPVTAARGGYLQAIDVESLMAIATKHDLVLRLPHRPGKFVVSGDEIARVWPAHRLEDDLIDPIRGAFYVGNRRTLTQDVEFAVDQLVEIAVRALSPGVNDPFTAIHCVDRLGSSLAALVDKDFPSASRFDADGTLRVEAEVPTIAGIVDAAFNQIRQAARNDTAVTLRLLESIAVLGVQAPGPDFRAALRRQAEMIERGARKLLPEEEDVREVEGRFRDAIRALD